MVRSTDSRRARNSDSVMIGGRRRPVSRPSRRRCFLASSRVDPLTDAHVVVAVRLARRARRCPAGRRASASPSPPGRRPNRGGACAGACARCCRPGSSSSAASAVRRRLPAPPSWPTRRRRPRCAGRVRGVLGRAAPARLRVRGGWPAPSGWSAPFPAVSRLGRVLGFLGGLVSGWPSPASAAASRRRSWPGRGSACACGGAPPRPSSSSPGAAGAGRPRRSASALPGVIPGPGRAADAEDGPGRRARRRAGSGRAVRRLEHHRRRLEHRRGHTRGQLAGTTPARRVVIDSLSFSSLSSIRAISSQAPGRAVPRRSAQWRRTATHPHTAREHVVNEGPGGAALAALDSRGTARARQHRAS